MTIPTYLKFCESLGLTPAGRVRLDDVKKQQPTGKLAQLRAVHARWNRLPPQESGSRTSVRDIDSLARIIGERGLLQPQVVCAR